MIEVRTKHIGGLLIWPLVAASVAGLAGGLAAADIEALRATSARIESTDECRRCHFRRPEETKQLIVTDSFCIEEQATTWETLDKHRQSFHLLVNERNRPLSEQILGFSLADVLSLPKSGDPAGALRAAHYLPDADPAKKAMVQQCLACHAPIAEPVARGAAQLTLENGVSCQVCHGPSRAYIQPHQDTASVWRIVKADAKESLFGLRDLRHPVKRAQLCASCHVGSFDSQWKIDEHSPPRFIKHEWYAKGHPPLPSLEFVAFSSQMPLHWRPLAEKLAREKFAWFDGTPEGKDRQTEIDRFIDSLPRSVKIEQDLFASSYREANEGRFSPNPVTDLHRSKDVLTSGLGVLSAYASLLAQAPDDMRTDFSLFDCGACHHELRSSFPGQARVRRSLPPGRLPPAYWTLALSRQAAGRSGMSSEFASSLAELNRAFGVRPFGDPARVQAAAIKLEAACTSMGNALAAAPLDEGAASELLSSLARPQHDEDRDYHTARQLAWAIREVISDLAAVPVREETIAADGPRRLGKHLSPALVDLLGFPVGQEITSDNPQVRTRISGLFGTDEWQGPLRLRLPAGQQESIVGRLPESLAAISQYDPAWFRKRLLPIQVAFPRPEAEARP